MKRSKTSKTWWKDIGLLLAVLRRLNAKETQKKDINDYRELCIEEKPIFYSHRDELEKLSILF